MSEVEINALVQNTFSPIKDMLLTAIKAVLPIALPVFGVIAVALIALVVFKDAIAAAVAKKRHYEEFDAQFSAYDEEFSKNDDLFDYLGIDDEPEEYS